MEEHLNPFHYDTDSESQDFDNSESDSSFEIASTINETENELVELSTYLHLESDEESNDDDDHFQWPDPPLLDSLLPDHEDLINTDQELPTKEQDVHTIDDKSTKRKRRQWSVKEKLDTIFSFQENENKRKTAKEHGCSTAQLRQWIKNKEDLLKLYQAKKGKSKYFCTHKIIFSIFLKTLRNILYLGNKRKRLNGGGKKLVFHDLDVRLMSWYRSKRTDPKDSSIPSSDIRRDKVTLRRLEKEGRFICKSLDQAPPSSTWYLRFLKRHGLSLQRPKRKLKVPLDEVHRLATSFYSYIRQASRSSFKRGPMGTFTPRDVCNMDESPLALFGDQNKKTINDVGTSNEITGYVSDKVRHFDSYAYV